MGYFGKRKDFLRTNKFQRKIIAIILLPAFLLSVILTILIINIPKEMTEFTIYNVKPLTLRILEKWGVYCLVGLWVLFIVLLRSVFYLSSSLVGAFERIIKELDGVIEGKGKKLITARSKDYLAKELLKRVNILIKGYFPSRSE